MLAYRNIQLGDFCDCLQVKERELRYILERGCVPAGVEKYPKRGNHRQFDPGQAFWLAMVVKLKQSGVTNALAAQIANYAEESLHRVSRGSGSDWNFAPSEGKFDTAHDYYVEIGDMHCIRLVTTADSSSEAGSTLEWHRLKAPRRLQPSFQPVVTIRVDLAELAHTAELRLVLGLESSAELKSFSSKWDCVRAK